MAKTSTKTVTKTKNKRSGNTTTSKTTTTQPLRYEGKAGKRQYKMDKIEARNKQIAGSKIKQATSGAAEVIHAAGTQTAGNITAANVGRGSTADQVVNSWNDIISGVPSAAEGTSEGKKGNEKNPNVIGDIPNG